MGIARGENQTPRFDIPGENEFDGKNFRTSDYNKMLDVIYKETKHLRGKKKPESSKNSKDSGEVPGAGLEPAHL